MDIKGLKLLGHSDLGGPGDGMQVMYGKGHAFVGRPSPGTPFLIIDVRNPADPRIVAELPAYPGTWMPKCQLYGDLLVVNYEQRRDINPAGRTGWGVVDVSNPASPREICYVDTGGKGVHRMWWAGERYCFASTRPAGFEGRMLQVYDMARPEAPQLAGQWWTPGLHSAGGEPEQAPRANGAVTQIHHGIAHGDRLYCGHGPAGLLILDIADPKHLTVAGELEWPGEGGATHTALPLPSRGLVAVVDEAQSYRPPDLFPVGDREYRAGSANPTKPEKPKYLRIIDVADETSPKVLGKWRPDPEIFGQRAGRYGPHNLHENRPGAYRGETMVFGTFFNAGLHVIDTSDPADPQSVAHFIPDAGDKGVWTNDLVVGEDGLILVTDRANLGMHILEMA